MIAAWISFLHMQLVFWSSCGAETFSWRTQLRQLFNYFWTAVPLFI